ncbi:MAG: taurine dioxygenase [Alphaproteobacteria bacterium]|nr:taurine dioxygenase [Alphaproteobacteria bacterium]
MTRNSLTIEPLTPVIGAEISGLDLTQPLSDSDFDMLNKTLAERQVIFFRDQDQLTPTQQIELGRRFGPMHIHPAAPHLEGHPEIIVIHTHKDSKIANGNSWHSDVSCDPEPPLGSILQMRQLPTNGGDTLFASMYAAYDALSDRMKAFLTGLVAVHASEHVYRGRYSDRGVDDTGKVFPANEHPIVRTHPVSGRPALYINRTFTTRITELSERESDALLAFLFDHCERAEFQVRFKWTDNAIAFWDNRCAQHLAMWDYWPEERIAHRVTIKGDRPVFHTD